MIGARSIAFPPRSSVSPGIYVTFEFVEYSQSLIPVDINKVRTVTPRTTEAVPGGSFSWDWGDGTVEYGLTESPGPHTYSGNGPYTIAVRGAVRRIAAPEMSALGWLESPVATIYYNKELRDVSIIGMSDLVEIGYGAMFSYFPDTSPSCTLHIEDTPSLVSIGDYAFNSMGSATNGFVGDLDLPSLVSLGKSSFAGSKLTSVNIPSVISIPDAAFTSSRITTILAGSVRNIGVGAFYGCRFLSRFEFGRLVSIGDSAFYNCVLMGMTDSTVDTRDLTNLGGGAFYCTNFGRYRWDRFGEYTTVDFTSLVTVGGDSSNVMPFGGPIGFAPTAIRFVYSESNRSSLMNSPLFSADDSLGVPDDQSVVEYV